MDAIGTDGDDSEEDPTGERPREILGMAVGRFTGEVSGEPSQKPHREQGGDAPGDRLAEPALQVADEPIEIRG